MYVGMNVFRMYTKIIRMMLQLKRLKVNYHIRGHELYRSTFDEVFLQDYLLLLMVDFTHFGSQSTTKSRNLDDFCGN